MAIRMFNTGKGACWDYAAIMKLMLDAAGYNSVIVVGKGAIYSEHNWLLVEVSDGVWRHYDPERQRLDVNGWTDEKLSSYNWYTRGTRYEWNKDDYPAAE
jgi:hypothetical protein